MFASRPNFPGRPSIYSYYPSREGLFVEIVIDASEGQFQATLSALDPPYEDFEPALVGLDTQLLSHLLPTPLPAVRRLVVSEARRPEPGMR